jgi:hypothetical protein
LRREYLDEEEVAEVEKMQEMEEAKEYRTEVED